jgi:hypothetical protein
MARTNIASVILLFTTKNREVAKKIIAGNMYLSAYRSRLLEKTLIDILN